MKYLKKFSTEEEKTEWRKNPSWITPNIVLCNRGVEYNCPTLRGVCIQHIDGTLYTKDEWIKEGFLQEQANGVAIVDDRLSFVVAKTTLGNDLVWSTSEGLIEGATISSSSDVTEYIDGVSDTEILVESGICPAAQACSEYTFPNGKKGHLPSLSEWKVFASYQDDFKTVQSLIGGASITSSYSARYFWSSTQSDSIQAWAWASRMGIQRINKTDVDEYQGNTIAFGVI